LAADLAAQVHIRSGTFNHERIAAMRAAGGFFFNHLFSIFKTLPSGVKCMFKMASRHTAFSQHPGNVAKRNQDVN
jgi:hypothetical protein